MTRSCGRDGVRGYKENYFRREQMYCVTLSKIDQEIDTTCKQDIGQAKIEMIIGSS